MRHSRVVMRLSKEPQKDCIWLLWDLLRASLFIRLHLSAEPHMEVCDINGARNWAARQGTEQRRWLVLPCPFPPLPLMTQPCARLGLFS
jgi:hypothetical protein